MQKAKFKGLSESHYWIKLIRNGKMLTSKDDVLNDLFNESMELANITAKSVVTAKSKILKTPTRN